jgi:hypothetical protein
MLFLKGAGHIDYKCEDSRFLVSTSRVTLSNPNLLSSSETGAKSWNKKLKKALIWMSPMLESHWWYLSYKKGKS